MQSLLLVALCLVAPTLPGVQEPAAEQTTQAPAAGARALPDGASLRLGTTNLLHPTRVLQATLAPDGSWFATGAEDGWVRIWKGSDGSHVRDLDARGFGAIVGLAVSPDGARLAVGTRHQCLQLFDMETGRQIFARPETGSVPAWHPDGNLIVGEYGPLVRVVDPKSAAVLEEVNHDPFTVEEILVSPCQRFLAVRALNRAKLLRRGGTEDQDRSAVFVRDARSLELIAAIPFADASALAMVFSGDGSRLYIGDDLGRVDQYDTVNRKELTVAAGDQEGIFAMAIDADNKTLSLARLGGEVDRLDCATMERTDTWRRGRLPYDRLLTRGTDGALLCLTAGVVELRRPEDGTPVLAPARHVNVVTSLAYSPDGQWIASAGHDSTVRLWRAATGEPQGDPLFHGGWIFDLVWLPPGAGGASLASACRDGGVYLWTLGAEPSAERLETGPLAVTSIDVDPSGRWLAAGIADGNALVLAVNSGERTEVGATAHGSFQSLGGLEPSARFAGSVSRGVIAGADLRLYDFEKMEELASLGEFGVPVRRMDVSEDGRLVAVGLADGVVRVLELEGGKRRPPFLGQLGRINGIALSPDGRRVAAVSEFDDRILVWDTATSKEVARFSGQGAPLSSVAFSPDGKSIATGAFDGTILTWRLEE